MSQESYRRLAEHLDRLPGGFAPSETGGELRLLATLFTPQEAELAVHLTLDREPARVIAERARLPIAEVELPSGASLVSGQLRDELGQLEGRAYKPSAHFTYYASDVTEDRAKVEWLVHAPEGGVAILTARHDRAGLATAAVDLTPASGDGEG